MTQMPPDEQLRQLLARNDRLLADVHRQNHDLHEWAVRYGPRPLEGVAATTVQPPMAATAPSFPPPVAQSPLYPPPASPAPTFPPPVGPPHQAGVTGQSPLDAETQAPRQPVPPSAPSKPQLSTTQLVARLVAGAGALVTLVGIAFILVLAAQYGYFGPAPRAISAAGLGVVLTGFAFVLHRRDAGNAGGPALLATGMASGFLSLVAATTLYDLIPGSVGLVLAGVLGVAVSVVAVLWSSEWLASLAIAAALVIGPWVSGDIHVGAAFMVVLSTVAAIAHLRVRWPAFQLARTLPTTILLVSLAASYGLSLSDAWLLVTLSAVHAAMGILSVMLGRKASDGEQWSLVAVLVGPTIPLLMLAGFSLPKSQGAGVAFVAAAAYVLVALAPGTKDWVKAGGVALAGIFALVAVSLATDLDIGGVLLPGLAVAYTAAAAGMRRRSVGVVAIIGSCAAVLGWLVQGVPAAFGIRFVDVLSGSLLIAALAMVGHLALRRILEDRNPGWLRYALIALGLLGASAAVTSVGTITGTALGNATSIEQASSVVVTVGWALASVVILRRPLTSTDHAAGWIRLGLCLAGAATAKLFLVDLALLPGLARGVAFLLVGLLLLVLGISYAKAYERARGGTPPAPVLAPTPPPGPMPGPLPGPMYAPFPGPMPGPMYALFPGQAPSSAPSRASASPAVPSGDGSH